MENRVHPRRSSLWPWGRILGISLGVTVLAHAVLALWEEKISPDAFTLVTGFGLLFIVVVTAGSLPVLLRYKEFEVRIDEKRREVEKTARALQRVAASLVSLHGREKNLVSLALGGKVPLIDEALNEYESYADVLASASVPVAERIAAFAPWDSVILGAIHLNLAMIASDPIHKTMPALSAKEWEAKSNELCDVASQEYESLADPPYRTRKWLIDNGVLDQANFEDLLRAFARFQQLRRRVREDSVL